jgi:hypothetical protein
MDRHIARPLFTLSVGLPLTTTPSPRNETPPAGIAVSLPHLPNLHTPPTEAIPQLHCYTGPCFRFFCEKLSAISLYIAAFVVAAYFVRERF